MANSIITLDSQNAMIYLSKCKLHCNYKSWIISLLSVSPTLFLPTFLFSLCPATLVFFQLFKQCWNFPSPYHPIAKTENQPTNVIISHSLCQTPYFISHLIYFLPPCYFNSLHYCFQNLCYFVQFAFDIFLLPTRPVNKLQRSLVYLVYSCIYFFSYIWRWFI